MTRNLSDVLTQLPIVNTTQGVNVFLTVFSINLSIRYPNANVETVDTTELRRIADFSALCSVVALDAWERFSEEDRRRQSDPRISRRTG